MSLTALPDLPLIQVFKHLTVEELLSIDQCYEPWKPLKREACNKRHHLALLVGPNTPKHRLQSQFTFPHADELITEDGTLLFGSTIDTDWSQLSYSQLNDEICQNIPEMLPNITHLEVHLVNAAETESEMDTVSHHLLTLLQNWSNKLLSFKLFKFQESFVHHFGVDFFNSFNSLQLGKLKHLAFEFTQRDTLSFSREELCLPILAQLESFAFWADGGAQLTDSIETYASANDNLKSLALCNVNYDNRRLLHHRKWKPLKGRFSYLQLAPYEFIPDLSGFTSLKQLRMKMLDCSMHEVSTALEPLGHLRFFDYDLADSPLITYGQLTPCPTVQGLRLSYWGTHHLSLDAFDISTLFPNVQILILVNTRSDCHDCRFSIEDTVGVVWRNRCKQKQLQCLKSCSKLKKIVLVKSPLEVDMSIDRKVVWTLADL